MYRWAVSIGLAAALMFGCEQREQEQAPTPPPQQTGQQQTGAPADQQQQTAGQEQPQSLEQQALAQRQEESAPAQDEASPPAAQEQQMAQQQQPAQESAGAQESAQQSALAGDSAEFLGQSPPFGDAPAIISLQAKNGNVQFPHKDHADMMACQTCHGEGKPGQIEGFGKDPAHALCMGCHKEKGAGPTKCPDCHKKQ